MNIERMKQVKALEAVLRINHSKEKQESQDVLKPSSEIRMRGWFIRALSEELSSAHREDCLNLERCSKNFMAILRDVVMCYDGTVRNVCSNPITQSEYGGKA